MNWNHIQNSVRKKKQLQRVHNFTEYIQTHRQVHTYNWPLWYLRYFVENAILEFCLTIKWFYRRPNSGMCDTDWWSRKNTLKPFVLAWHIHRWQVSDEECTRWSVFFYINASLINNSTSLQAKHCLKQGINHFVWRLAKQSSYRTKYCYMDILFCNILLEAKIPVHVINYCKSMYSVSTFDLG